MDRRLMRGCGRNPRAARSKKFIYDLPHRDYKDVEDMLNMNDVWETVAGEHLQLRVGEIDKMRRFNLVQGTSAAKALLDYLSNRNTTIQDLFLLLHKVELYRGMDILKQHVPEKFHPLIRSGPALATQPSSYPSLAPVQAKLMPTFSVEAEEEETRSQNLGTVSVPAPPDLSTARLVSGSPAASDPSHLQSVERLRHLSDLERVRHVSETRTEDGSSFTASSYSSSSGGVPVVSYREIASACGNWDPANKLGEGGFGQVFKGVWKHQEVAIKTIKRDKYLVNENTEHRNKSIIQCFKEIEFLNRLRSEFIVPIIARSEAKFGETWEPCIVYQWMPNGSLDDRLQKKGGSPALTWLQRYNIGLGVANGIQFLHNHDQGAEGTGKQLIHGDIKSANILLDKNFEPKIGDFGLAREVEGGKSKYFVLSTIYGTQFYLPQDFLRSKKLSAKVDTYSFGVILFDLVTGKRPQTRVGKEYLLDIVRESEQLPREQVDTSWPEQHVNSHLCKILYNFGKQCTQDRARHRPEMEEVYQNLKKAGQRRDTSAPSPYEIQQRFDSMNKAGTGPGPAAAKVTQWDGFVVNDNVNLIDLSSPSSVSAATLTSSSQLSSQLLPATISRAQAEESAYLPAVISDLAASSDIPVLVNQTLEDLSASSSSTLSATTTLSLPSEDAGDSLNSLERDIEQSAQLLSALGF